MGRLMNFVLFPFRLVIWIVFSFLEWLISLHGKKKYHKQNALFQSLSQSSTNEKSKNEQTFTEREKRLLRTPAFEIAQQLRSGTLSSSEIVGLYIRFIKLVNPVLNAVVVDCFKKATECAQEADAKLQSWREGGCKEELPPLLGVPMTIKEAFGVEGLPHTSGLLKRSEVRAKDDAVVVRHLKEAGVVILGLTNISELCMWYESHNPIYGRSLNPYNPLRIVGGSSGGEGAILGSGASVIGLGSDVGGSIRMPCFFNGIFGHKPSALLVTNTGQYPDAEDTAIRMLSTGPMVRYASDLMPLLRVMSGLKNKEQQMCLSPHHAQERENHICVGRNVGLIDPECVNFEKLTIYLPVPDSPSPMLVCSVNPEILETIENAAAFMESKGANVIRCSFKEIAIMPEMWSSLLHVAKQPSFAMRMGSEQGKGQEVSGMGELLKFLFGRSEHTLPAIGLALVEKFPELTPTMTKDFLSKCDQLRQDLIKLLCPPNLAAALLEQEVDGHEGDICHETLLLGDLISLENGKSEEKKTEKNEREEKGGVIFLPTFPKSAPIHNMPLLGPFDFAFCAFVNALHFPSTHVPMGLDTSGLPIGFQIVGGPAMDSVTISVAMELERQFGGWVPPPIFPS